MLTILQTLHPVIATKTWTFAEGKWTVEGYGKAANFHAAEIDGRGIDALAVVIKQYATDPHAMVVRGALTEAARSRLAADPAATVNRRKRDREDGAADFVEVPQQWFMGDVDGFPMLPGETWAGAIQRFIDQMLPACFQEVRCFWQLSSSAGFVPGTLKVHLWFWLSEPLTDAVLKATIAQQVPGFSDLSVYQGVQPHYIANPVIIGGADPVPDRFGWTAGWFPAVTLPAYVPGAVPDSEAGQGTAGGDWVDRLANTAYGFHEPTRSAAWQYAEQVQRGDIPRNDEVMIDAIMQACADKGVVRSANTRQQHQDNISGAFRAERIKDIEPLDRTPMLTAIEPPPSPFKLRHPGEWSALKRSPSLIDGMLPAQGTGVLYAPPGSFKSFIALGLAFAVATGKAAFGQYAASRTAPVVYCAGEGHLAVASQRLPALFGKHDVRLSKDTPLYLMNGVPLAIEPNTAADFLASIKAQVPEAPALVVIDTMARSLAGLNENDASEAGRFVTLMETLASELECFVLAVGHEGKDSSKGVRGSSAVQAGVDVIWQAQRPTEASMGVSLHCRKDKDGDAHETIYLMGEKFGGSVVFSDMPKAEWMKGSGKRPGMVSAADVGHALDDLGAIEGKTVSNTVLAEQLAGPSADDATIKAKKIALGRGIADGSLLPYVVHMSTGTRDPHLWSIPAAP